MSDSLHGMAQRIAQQTDAMNTFKREQREKMLQLGHATVKYMQEAEDRAGRYTELEASARRAEVEWLRDLLAVLEHAVYRQRWWQLWRPRRPAQRVWRPVDPLLTAERGVETVTTALQNGAERPETPAGAAFDAVGRPVGPPEYGSDGMRHG